MQKKNPVSTLISISFFLLFLFTGSTLFAQVGGVGINNDGSNPADCAMLDVKSTSKGMLIPRMNAAQRLAMSPVEGLLVYQNSGTTGFYYYDGGAWRFLTDNAHNYFLSDGDGDTKITVDNGGDEDVIRFSSAGTEYLVIENGRLRVLNTGASVFLGEGAGENDDLNLNGNVFVGLKAGEENTEGQTNIGLGLRALNKNISGYSNVALGVRALHENTDRHNIVAVGDSALFKNGMSAFSPDDGSENTAIGSKAMYNNDVGYWNTATGFKALAGNSDGDYNTAFGHEAAFTNFYGNNNTCIGSNSGYWNLAGNQNTMIGSFAGYGPESQSISGSVFLGYEAGSNEAGNNKLYIENSNSSSPLIYGEFDNDLLRVNGTLHIKNEYKFPTVDGGNGQVLKTDGSGLLSWGVDQGALNLDGLSDAKTIGPSIFIGQGAGENDNNNSNSNLGIGENALYTNSSGYDNLAIGENALYDIVSGDYNLSIGNNSSPNLVGGEYNLVIGHEAASFNELGEGNIVIGHLAGQASANYSGNILIGNLSGFSETGSNKLYIENSESTSPLIYGEFDNDLLRINGTLDINNNYQFPDGDGTNGQIMSTDGSGTLSWTSPNVGDITKVGSMTLGNTFSDSNADDQWLGLGSTAARMVFDDQSTDEINFLDANVGIGTNSPAVKLSLSGGSNASLAIGTGYFQIGDENSTNLIFDNNEILARNNGVLSPLYLQAEGGDLIVHNDGSTSEKVVVKADGKTGVGTGNPEVKLHIDNGSDASLSDGSGYFLIGDQDGTNILMDNNELMARNDGATSTLSIQNNGGDTNIGGDINIEGNTEIYGILRLQEPPGNGTHYTSFNAAAQSSNINYLLPATNGDPGQFLRTDGSGILSWEDDQGALELNDLSDAKTAGTSIFIGEAAGENDYSTFSYNVGIGYNALFTNLTGVSNCAIGAEALYNNNSGINNIAIGRFAMKDNISGMHNIALGQYTFSNNTNGDYNIIIGGEAGYNNDGGINNVILGYKAGRGTGNTSYSGNVFLGYAAGYYETGSERLYIENSNSSTPLIYGEFENDLVTIYGNLGVGTKEFGNGANTLALSEGSNPTSSITDGIILFAKEVASSSELRVRDEAGNITTLSPHNFSLTGKSEPMAWSFYSKNAELGQTINVDMLRVVRLVEQMSGEKLVNIKSDSGEEIQTEKHMNKNSGQIEDLKEEISDLKGLIQKLEKRIAELEK